jgi:hypothetical protein
VTNWFFGLPWGKGDPAVADLQDKSWVVFRVDQCDACVRVEPAATTGSGFVSFRSGTVVYKGAHRGALEYLILAGADPEAMTIRLVLGDEGVAIAGHYGVAIGGETAYARAGVHGRAEVEGHGVSLAGPSGEAIAGNRGIAIADEAGLAKIAEGQEGIAIARGRNASAIADCGAAVAMERAGTMVVGQGAAIAPRGARAIYLRREGIVVIRGALTDRTLVSAGAGALIVYHPKIGDGASPKFAVRVVENQAGEEYVAVDAVLRERKAIVEEFSGELEPTAPVSDTHSGDVRLVARAGPRIVGSEPIPKWWDGGLGPLPNAKVATIDPAQGDLVVLQRCMDAGYHAPLGEIRAESWDPDPSSPHGLFGLAWGEGDPKALGNGHSYRLVRVPEAEAVTVQTEKGMCVKFQRGDVMYEGPLAGALKALEKLGADLRKLAVGFAQGGVRELARLGAGWARAGEEGCALSAEFAEAGDGGYAEVRGITDGVAVAGRNGIARAYELDTAVAGDTGIAISDGERLGYAFSGEGGVSIATGPYKHAESGGGGVALGLRGYSNTIRAGNEGIAVGTGNVFADTDGIAIQTSRDKGWQIYVSGGPGCLLVAPSDIDEGGWVHAVVGEVGIEAYAKYVVRDGMFSPLPPDPPWIKPTDA